MTVGNLVKTTILMAADTAILVAVGNWAGGTGGMVVATAMALLLNGLAYGFGDRVILRWCGARPARAPGDQRLCALVERLAAQAGLVTPHVVVLPAEFPNSFATGRSRRHATIVLTTGLLALLTDDELEAVLAHEIAHIWNRDHLLGSLVAVLARALMLPLRLAGARDLAVGFGSSVDQEAWTNSKFRMFLFLLVTPIATLLIQAFNSRGREYLADEFAAALTTRPICLANALLKLDGEARPSKVSAPLELAHLFIVNPLPRDGVLAMLGTHPQALDRARALTALAMRTAKAPPTREAVGSLIR